MITCKIHTYQLPILSPWLQAGTEQAAQLWAAQVLPHPQDHHLREQLA